MNITSCRNVIYEFINLFADQTKKHTFFTFLHDVLFIFMSYFIPWPIKLPPRKRVYVNPNSKMLLVN